MNLNLNKEILFLTRKSSNKPIKSLSDSSHHNVDCLSTIDITSYVEYVSNIDEVINTLYKYNSIKNIVIESIFILPIDFINLNRISYNF